jgi:hypothetical protein
MIAVAQDAGPRPARTRHRRVRQVGWALLPIVSLTLLAWWPFLVLALIRRRSRDWAVFAVYLAALVAEIVTFAAAGILPVGTVADDVAAILFYAIILLVVITATVHTLVAFRPGTKLPYLSDAALARTAAKRQARAASGIVTICEGQGLFLRADDACVLVRNFHFGHARRIAWTEISHFADGRYTKEGVTSWMLVIILRTGKQVRVLCSVLASADEVVAAVRKAAQPHGIPAELAGVPVKNGRPPQRGLYHDPSGQAGLRYWDGRQWSPLLPPDVSKWSARAVGGSAGSWSALPTADGRWTYAAAQATRETIVFAVAAAVSAALLAAGLAVELWWDPGTHHRHLHGWAFCAFAAAPALIAFVAWKNRRLFLKLDEAANGSAAVAGEWN